MTPRPTRYSSMNEPIFGFLGPGNAPPVNRNVKPPPYVDRRLKPVSCNTGADYREARSHNPGDIVYQATGVKSREKAKTPSPVYATVRLRKEGSEEYLDNVNVEGVYNVGDPRGNPLFYTAARNVGSKGTGIGKGIGTGGRRTKRFRPIKIKKTQLGKQKTRLGKRKTQLGKRKTQRRR